MVDQTLVPLRRPASSNNSSNNNSSSPACTGVRASQGGARPATAGPPRVAACLHGENRLGHATGGRGGSGRRRSRSAPGPLQLPPSLCSSVYGKTSKATGTTAERRPPTGGRLPRHHHHQQQHGKDARNRVESVRAMLPWWQYPAATDARPGKGDFFAEAPPAATRDTAGLRKKQAALGNNVSLKEFSVLSADAPVAARDKMCQLTGKLGDGLTSTQELLRRSRSISSPGVSASTSHTAQQDDDDGGWLYGEATRATRAARGLNPRTHAVENVALNDDQLNETCSAEHAIHDDGQLHAEATRDTVNSGVNSPVNAVESAYDTYTDCSNLFENPPPSIPDVDQYIRRESVMYEAITQRARSKALPVKEPNGVLRVTKGANVERDAFVEDGGLEADIDPSALLFGDEDIDKVRFFSEFAEGCLSTRGEGGGVVSVVPGLPCATAVIFFSHFINKRLYNCKPFT